MIGQRGTDGRDSVTANNEVIRGVVAPYIVWPRPIAGGGLNGGNTFG